MYFLLKLNKRNIHLKRELVASFTVIVIKSIKFKSKLYDITGLIIWSILFGENKTPVNMFDFSDDCLTVRSHLVTLCTVSTSLCLI